MHDPRFHRYQRSLLCLLFYQRCILRNYQTESPRERRIGDQPSGTEGSQAQPCSESPPALPLLTQFLTAVSFEIVRPTKREVLLAAAYTELKDAPIVAAAKQAHVDYLVSLDRRHLVGLEIVRANSGLTIVLPEEFLSRLRSRTSHKAAA